VTATFAKDCCDREVMAWRAWKGKGLPGEPVREMLIEAVERRFGTVEAIPADHPLEFLSDNGGAYIAADTRGVAWQLGLKPINTPVCSPQSNGMAESFVNTFKRDYVSRMDLTDARTVMAQLPAAFEHFNAVHPHSSLKMQRRGSSGGTKPHKRARLRQPDRRYIATRTCPGVRGQDQGPGWTRSPLASMAASAREDGPFQVVSESAYGSFERTPTLRLAEGCLRPTAGILLLSVAISSRVPQFLQSPSRFRMKVI
jgi:hypothetical protein